MIIWKTPMIAKIREALGPLNDESILITVSTKRIGLVDIRIEHHCVCGLVVPLLIQLSSEGIKSLDAELIQQRITGDLSRELGKHLMAGHPIPHPSGVTFFRKPEGRES